MASRTSQATGGTAPRVLALDQQHEIPYAVLKAARERAIALQRENDELRARLRCRRLRGGGR